MYLQAPKPNIMLDTEVLRNRFHQFGFGLHQFFSVSRYNDIAPDGFALPQTDSGYTVGMLVANQRQLWPHFIDYLRQDPTRIEDENPLDQYTERCFSSALDDFTQKTIVRYAHSMQPSPLAMQHLSESCGFAQRSKSHLCLHPIYGSWIGFRGVILFEKPYEIPDFRSGTGCTASCAKTCERAFEQAVVLLKEQSHEEIGRSWRRWAQVRMLCSVGQQHRYSESQLEYHYTHNKEILRREILSVRDT